MNYVKLIHQYQIRVQKIALQNYQKSIIYLANLFRPRTPDFSVVSVLI